MNLNLITTKDGSHSLFNKDLNETYHSVGGALQESLYIYIQQGLKVQLEKENSASILEVGFGTGLNAILSYEESLLQEKFVNYTTLEPFPVPYSLIIELNYPTYLKEEYLKDAFFKLHQIHWEQPSLLSENFRFTKHKIRLEEFDTKEKFDVVFFDAFAPSKQADIWGKDNLLKIKQLLSPEGFLITYCSSGSFKRSLKEIGFTIETLPGPLGKREITRAIVIS